MNGQVLIAGVGNIFLGDDGFGVEVLRRIAELGVPENVCARDFGIRGFDLVYALMEEWDLVILVDVTERGGAPGHLYVIEHAAEDRSEAGQTSLDPHGMHPVRALGLVRTMGSQAPPMIVIGCEPEDLGGEEGKMGLSDAVTAVVDQAAALALRMAAERASAAVS
jgi:hydrogenase maturation protease